MSWVRFFFSFCLLVSSQSFALEIKSTYHANLKFTAAMVEDSQRASESFNSQPVDSVLDKLLRSTVEQTIALLPAKYLPPRLDLYVEDHAVFTNSKGESEYLPLSMFLTTQLPIQNAVRITTFDMNESDSIRTIFAHEIGHMLIEWACRSEGVTQASQTTSHWSGAIYEGVADYISATVNNTTLIGGVNQWFTRDISKFKSYEEAMNSRETSISVVESGLISEGLIPQYRTYTNEMNEFKKELAEAPDYHDAYTIGAWLAGELYKLNREHNRQSVFNAVLKVAISGRPFSDARVFLAAVKSELAH